MRRPILLALAAWPAAAHAQAVVDSPAPAGVAVTLYRAADRGAGGEIDRRDPGGYALVTETRTVTLPAGPAVLRFQGVAGNIFPETAIITGLPADVAEKNLDADLLSPRSLYDRALGRRVTIRRTDPATGRVREEQATIRSAADGAAVIRTADGYEGLRCSGLPETLAYPELPPGLVAKPTLSVSTASPRAVTATVTLSYLAGGFDWQADYVVTMRPDGRHADVFAWITLASSDVTGFADAGTAVVAGKPNRSDARAPGPGEGQPLTLRCYPTDPRYASSTLFAQDIGAFQNVPPPPPAMMAPAPAIAMRAMDVVVTGARLARQEELGDLKLYRFPQPVTLSAKAQKQVGLLERRAVPVAPVYVSEEAGSDPQALRLVLRAANRRDAGLGLPLPAGHVAVFADGGGRPVLLGEADSDDRAVGEKVEWKLPAGPQVRVTATDLPTPGDDDRTRLTVTNANPWPIAYEARFRPDAAERLTADAPLARVDGRLVWAVTVSANGTRTLTLRTHTLD